MQFLLLLNCLDTIACAANNRSKGGGGQHSTEVALATAPDSILSIPKILILDVDEIYQREKRKVHGGLIMLIEPI